MDASTTLKEGALKQDEGRSRPVVIIGGGPAGLTAAYELVKLGIRPIVIEKRDRVGGIARTENYKGYYFDMGGHRFFTKAPEVNRIWREVLGADFLRRPRLSRIFYRKRFFFYPLRPLNALRQLGLIEAILNVLSYIRWQLFPFKEERSFEQWVTNRFGARLFQALFKTYTEKVWGVSTSELSAEWAAQRIKNLSLGNAIISMFIKPKGKITSLIEEFEYPRYGPGMMWKAVQTCVEEGGGRVILNAEVVRVCRSGNHITGVVIRHDGREEYVPGSHFISSMALRDFVERVEEPPAFAVEAAAHLSYRDFLTVCLVVNQPDLFPDNWIYVHDPQVKVGRIQNFKNWSPDMVPDQSTTSLGLEYFCNEGDELWCMSDADLVELGKREIQQVGLGRSADVVDGCVYRVEKSYPVYDSTYREHLNKVRAYTDSFDNFVTIGRNGLHRYNNQDHAMMTGILAVRNLIHGEKNDLWSVNTDSEYHEEVREETKQVVREKLARGFPKLDPVALGLAGGLTVGLLLFLATLFLVLRDGPTAGPHLNLLIEFFPLYQVTLVGSLIGLAYGFASGFWMGWLYAALRNVTVLLSMSALARQTKVGLLWRSFW